MATVSTLIVLTTYLPVKSRRWVNKRLYTHAYYGVYCMLTPQNMFCSTREYYTTVPIIAMTKPIQGLYNTHKILIIQPCQADDYTTHCHGAWNGRDNRNTQTNTSETSQYLWYRYTTYVITYCNTSQRCLACLLSTVHNWTTDCYAITLSYYVSNLWVRQWVE